MKPSTQLLRTVCCGLLFLLFAFMAGAQTIYVTPTGAGDKSGSGWGNAMPGTQLQTAINNAVSGGQVWVAGGIYLPASSTAFSMKEGVKIYGGFAGTELSLNNRNLSIAANKSVLQGNGASVVRNSNNGLTNAAVLDGFTITGGTGSPVAFGPNTLNVGGGILLESASPVISNCIVTNNHGLDAAVFSSYSYPVFYNCVFSYNTTAGSDYVIHITDGHAYLNNCTLSGNSGGYVIAPNFGDVTVSNCIVWGNSAYSQIQVIISGSANVDHSIIQGGFSGSGNLNVDPLFVDAANGDFHLKPNSPAINTGDNSANSTATDLGGKTRIVGGTIDMGAYEFQCDPTILSAQPQNTSACTGGTATFTVGVTGPNLTYKWYKGGQSARSSNNSPTLTINGIKTSDAGNYTVDIISDCGTITSNAATLTVNQPPLITTQPVNTTVCEGTDATFSIGTTGVPAPTIQWQYSKDGGASWINLNTVSASSVSMPTAGMSGAYKVRAQVASACGAVNSDVVTLTINYKPLLTVSDKITTPDDQNSCGATVSYLGSTIGLPTPTISYKIDQTPITLPYTFPLGTTTVSVVATNTCGSNSKSVTVTVEDKTPPSITAPAGIIISTDIGACSASAGHIPLGTPTFSDCSNVTVSNDAPATFPKGITIVTWTATDAAGNKATATQAVMVADHEAPVVPDLPAITAECSATVTPTNGTDNCAGTVAPTTEDPLTYTEQGTYTIHWTYSDNDGNSIVKEQSVVIQDMTRPQLRITQLPDLTGECAVSVTTKPTAYDNCAGEITATTTDPLFYDKQGTYTIHWVYYDGHYNYNGQEQTVIVKDLTAPVPDAASLPDLIGECSVVVTTKPTATDNCAGKITATTTDALSYTTQGTYTITWNYDDGNGKTTTQTQNVIIKDLTKPVPDAATLPDLTGECGVTVATKPTATDNCTGQLIATTTDPLTYNMQGTYTIHWTYDDGNGNSTAQTQTVVVKDITKPVLDVANLPDVVGECSVTITSKPTATDNCAGKLTASTTDPLTYTAQGTYTVNWTYSDGNGNSSMQTQKVVVKDITKPLITPPAAITVSADAGKCSASVVRLGTPAVSDNCAVPSVTNDAPAVFPKGLTTVTWTVTDVAGNQSSATQTVTVTDNEKPVITCPAVPTTLCYSSGGTYTIASLQASDNCGIASTAYAITGATTRSGSGSNASGTFNPGISTITWTVKDVSGNTATCQTTVTVNQLLTVSIPDAKVLSSGVDVNTVYLGYTPAGTLTLSATVSGGSGNYLYKWSTGATTASIKVAPTTATTYTVTVTDVKGCTGMVSKQVKVVNAGCGSKVNVCHKGGNTLCIDKTSVPDHLGHGDYLGTCRTGANATMVATATDLKLTEEPTPLELTASPNPSTAYFNLQIKGKANEKVTLVITDMLGRIVESRTVAIGSVQVGATYRQGVYIATLVQGDKRVSVKLIKQG